MRAVWGCVVVALLGLGTILFGFDVVGRASGFLIFALVLVVAVRQRRFDTVIGPALRLDAHPIWFWLMVALTGSFAIGALFMLFNEVRASGL